MTTGVDEIQTPVRADWMPVQVPGTRRLFTVSEYHWMVAAGVFHEDDRIELIEGEFIEMSPINPSHAGRVNRLVRLFYRLLGDRAVISPQNPITIMDHSEPQPDVALLKPRDDFYTRSHPTPDDVLLVIEVSDATVEYDQNVKAALYARAGIPETWLVNLVEGRLEVFRGPGQRGYRERRLAWPGDEIVPVAFPDVVVKVSEILG